MPCLSHFYTAINKKLFYVFFYTRFCHFLFRFRELACF